MNFLPISAMRLVMAALLALTFAAPARAACSGTDILSSLTLAETKALDAADLVPFGTGRLWEVSYQGKRSLIFGTVHISGPGIALPPQLLAQIPKASKVWLEVTGPDQVAFQARIAGEPGLIFNLDGPDLTRHFEEAEWLALAQAMVDSGMPRLLLNRLKPWFANILLMTPPCAAQAALAGGPPGLDRQIEDLARAAGVPVLGLESMEEVITLFTAEPEQTHIDAIRLALPMLAERDAGVATVLALYRAGRTYASWTLSELLARRAYPATAMAKMAETWEVLVVKRNRNWLDAALPSLKEGGVIVAAGALHLPTEDGLLAMLQREGFSITLLAQ